MTDQAAEGLLSPYLQRRRIAAVRPYLNGRVLDVGCGSGALAGFVSPASYLGVDVDQHSLDLARARYPAHRFQHELPAAGENFDTVACLAVIEHVAEPARFLADLGARLAPSPGACVVLTTPHPAAGWLHTAGARVGLFSRHAAEEHDDLLDRARLAELALACRLRLARYRRFLFGVNQLAVLERSAP
jgi:2-polyprenyl-3-methyl-5-hydroxy-6-metoxy-1,4-benzoquinol methylase